MELQTGTGNGYTLRVVLPGFGCPCSVPSTLCHQKYGNRGLAGGDVRESRSKREMSFGLKYHCRENAETAS